MSSMNYAKPEMPFPKVLDIISLNYQGEGIRDAPAYANLKGIRTSPLYPKFKKAFPDKFFATQDQHPYVGGEFVWSGWDYLGEPTPYYSARSSYFGMIDLAGFKKDRFYPLSIKVASQSTNGAYFTTLDMAKSQW